MWKRLFSAIACTLVVLVMFSPICRSANEGEETTGTPAGWSDDINLSESSTGDSKCSIAVSGNDVHVIWRHTYVSAADYQVVYKRSNNGGMTWSPFVNISNSLVMADDSDIAVFNDNIHVVWENVTGGGIDEIYYRNSLDGGLSWNPEKQISAVTGAFALGPNIFVNNSNVHIIWLDLRASDQEMYYRRSLDGGITFDNGQGVDEDRRLTFSSSDVSYVRTDGDRSNISVLWCDESSGGDWDVYWMISKDNGFTWEDGLGTPNIGRRLTDDTTDSINPAIAVNGSNIHIIWVDVEWPGPEYRLYYRNSTDYGLTWNPIQLLTGPVPGINSPDIDVVGNNIYVVWDDERDDGDHEEIYYKNSMDGGITWTGDTRLTYNLSGTSYWPRLAVDDSIIHISWYDNRDGNSEIYYKRYPDFPPDPTYNISLDEGWNLISLPLEQRDESITEALSSIDGKWDYIQTYDALGESWLSNATFKPDQLNDFDTLDHKIGLWINITEPNVNLTVSGPVPSSTSIPLYAGWNLVGYPSLNETQTIGVALFGTTADNVMVCDPAEPYRIKEVGPGYIMKPGEGYWVHVVADSVWIVNW